MPLTSVQQAIVAAANAQGVPPALALAVADQESGFNQNSVGPAGDAGIFQIIPSTAAALGVDPTNEAQNIQGGVAYLGQQLAAFGDPRTALWAYNAGPSRVQAFLSTGQPVPASTVRYANAVLAKVPKYQAALGGPSASAPSAGAGAPPAAGGQSSSLPWILGGLGALVIVSVLTD